MAARRPLAVVSGALQELPTGDTVTSDTLPAHASSHGSGGSDPVTPAAIGAATSSHTHAAITPVSLAYAASLTPIYTDGPSRAVTLTGAATLNPPSSPVDGAKWEGRFYASGAIRVLTLGSSLRRPSSIANTVSIPAGLYADVALKYTTTAAEWAVLACQAYS